MAKKKSKIQTPDWILKGENPPKREKRGKSFKIRECPECGSDEVKVVLGGKEGGGGKGWVCHKCGWKGMKINKRILDEEEFLAYLESKKSEESS